MTDNEGEGTIDMNVRDVANRLQRNHMVRLVGIRDVDDGEACPSRGEVGMITCHRNGPERSGGSLTCPRAKGLPGSETSMILRAPLSSAT